MGSYTQRSADWVVQKAFAEAKAKAVMPPTGSTKYNLLLTLVDSEQKNWENEPGVQWDSLYLTTTLDDTVSATDTYDLSDDVRELSQKADDFVLVGGQPYKIVAPNQLYNKRFDRVVAKVGRTLKFSSVFASDSNLIGSSIIVPGYGYTDDITVGTDLVQVDDPMFLAYMTAASFARNDIVKLGQYNNILDKATNLMNKMKEQNGGDAQELTMNFQANGESWI